MVTTMPLVVTWGQSCVVEQVVVSTEEHGCYHANSKVVSTKLVFPEDKSEFNQSLNWVARKFSWTMNHFSRIYFTKLTMWITPVYEICKFVQ